MPLAKTISDKPIEPDCLSLSPVVRESRGWPRTRRTRARSQERVLRHIRLRGSLLRPRRHTFLIAITSTFSGRACATCHAKRDLCLTCRRRRAFFGQGRSVSVVAAAVVAVLGFRVGLGLDLGRDALDRFLFRRQLPAAGGGGFLWGRGFRGQALGAPR